MPLASCHAYYGHSMQAEPQTDANIFLFSKHFTGHFKKYSLGQLPESRYPLYRKDNLNCFIYWLHHNTEPGYSNPTDGFNYRNN